MRRTVTSRLNANYPWSRALVSAYGRLHNVGVRFSEDYIKFSRGEREIRIALSDFPYSRDMIAAFDSYHGAVVADAVGRVDYSRPGIHRYTKSGVEFSLPSIAEEEEALEAYFHWYKPQPGDLVFDLGAHAGVSTYALSKAVGPTGRVYAFEPDPITLPHLRRNVEDLGLSNVIVIPKAIAQSAGRMNFYAEGALGSALVDVASRTGTREMIEVEAITLADACHLATARPAYVKMDIEGAELDVIESSEDLLRGAAIHFAVDTNHRVGGGLTNRRLERLFAKAGYEAESSARYGFMTTWARPRDRFAQSLVL